MYQNVSERFLELLNEPSRQFKYRLEFSTYTIEEDVKLIKFYGGSSSDAAFALGNMISAYTEVTMAKSDKLIAGREFTLSIGMETNESEENPVEYVPIGIFKAERPQATDYEINFTAYDRMQNTNQSAAPEGTWTSTTTVEEVFNALVEQAGFEPTSLPAEISSLTLNDIYPAPWFYQHKLSDCLSGYTIRELLSYIAILCGGFGYVDRLGNLKIARYSNTTSQKLELDYDKVFDFNKTEDKYSIDKVIGKKTFLPYDGYSASHGAEGSEYTAGSGTTGVSFSSPFVSQALVEKILSSLKDFVYSGGNVKFLGNPLLDAEDFVSVTDKDGQEYLIPAFQIEQSFDGGLATTVIANVNEDSDIGSSFMSPVYSEIVRLNGMIADRVSSQYAKETYATIENLEGNKLSFIVFTNTDAIEIDDQKSKSVLNIRFIVAKTTHVAIDMEMLLSVETTETESGEFNWIENDAVVMATYYLDGEEVELRHPVETWQDGSHILHLRYDIQTIDAAIHTWGVWLTVNGGSVRIEPYAIYAVIMGTGMAAEEKWDGTIDAYDDVPRLSFDIFKGMQDIVNVVNREPVKSEIADGVGKINFFTMFRGIQDSIDVTADIMVYSPWINNDKVDTECTYDSKVGWIGNGELSSGTALTVTTVPMRGVRKVETESTNASFYASYDDGGSWLGWTEEGWIETSMNKAEIEAVPESAWAQGGETVQIRVVLEKNASLSELNVYGGKIDA